MTETVVEKVEVEVIKELVDDSGDVIVEQEKVEAALKKVEDVEKLSFEITDDTALPDVDERESKVDESLNEDKSEWQTWKEEEAFNVAGVSVTNEEAAVGSTVILIVIIGIVVICCFVSYLERKKIAEEARRASAYAKRAS